MPTQTACLSLLFFYFPEKKPRTPRRIIMGFFSFPGICESVACRGAIFWPRRFFMRRGKKGVFFSMSRIDRCKGGKKLLGGESSSELCVCIIFFCFFLPSNLREMSLCEGALFFCFSRGFLYFVRLLRSVCLPPLYQNYLCEREGGRSALKLFYLFSVAFFLSKAALF